MDAGGNALQSYVDKWLALQPAQRIALAFVEPARWPGHIALAALEQEIVGAAYGIREPQVAATKLNWWAEELAGAGQGGGRHPLTQVLFDDDRASRIDSERWLAPVLAAMAQLEEGTAADFTAQLDAAAQLHGALAALETAWWFDESAAPDRAARLAALTHLLHALRRLDDDAERDRLPLTMAALARHGLSRDQLRRPGPARNAAVRDQLGEITSAWRAAARLPGPLSVFRAVEAREAGRLALRAAAAAEPLETLQRARQSGGLATTLAAWQAARRWRRASGA
ncbi:squalene/phytoene synthase family protein [Frateuria hangzhouensis]|uniref:squalene/phytoene synthase family protein n=1 Tax=Frateuria hangzhouensis TaxID=2995589 RepID=UPI002260F2DC|nr:squalene/phytoene synthase family protein [Frateuria sp. STR12]MCX7514298.1 squalene/phytoene synthase family protein [Frateuria sp. STR12]